MMSYNRYVDLPKEPSAPPHLIPQAQPGELATPQSYRLNVIQSKEQGLLRLEEGMQRNTPSTPGY